MSSQKVNFNFTVCLFNAQSLSKKLDELKLFLSSGFYDFILITETRLTDNFTDDILCSGTGCNVFRCDGKNRSGGGVCIFVKNRFTVETISVPSCYERLEILCIDILISRHKKCRFVLFYRAPNCDPDSNDLMFDCFRLLCTDKQFFPVFLLGDFNVTGVDWSQFSLRRSDVLSVNFLEFVQEFSFSQIVNKPTRLTSFLDLVFCTIPENISSVDVEAPFSTSDHSIVTFSFELETGLFQTSVFEKELVFDFKRADFEATSTFLHFVDWPSIFSTCSSIDDFWNSFTRVLFSCFDLFVPKFFPRARFFTYPKCIKRLQKKRRILWRKLSASFSEDLAVKYCELSRLCRVKISEFFRDREVTILSANNDRAFYQYVDSQLNNAHNCIQLVLSSDGQLVADPVHIANTFNQFFSSVFICDNGLLPNCDFICPADCNFHLSIFRQRLYYWP